MKSLVVIVLVAIAFVFADLETDCIRSFMKNEELKSKDCEEIIKLHKKDFKELFDGYNLNQTEQSCVENFLDEYKIVNVYFKELLQSFENETEEKFQPGYFLEPLQIVCIDDITPYDEPFFKKRAEERNSHENLCMQKHLIAHGFINPTDYNIDTSTLETKDCEEAINNLYARWNYWKEEPLNQFSFAERNDVKKCIIDKFDAENIILKSLFYYVIPSLKITEEQRKQMKSKSVEFFNLKVKLQFECFKNLSV